MDRLNHSLDHEWHVALNRYNRDLRSDSKHWMYEAKRAADEVPRLTRLFRLEREGGLRKTHRQCSHQDPVPVEDNHLTCCLGVECRKCPHLLALDKMKAEPEQIDEAKAWTCMGHILTQQDHVDTSEGYVLTTDDRMFWTGLYDSLAGTFENEPTPRSDS
jgi:hypothetical protein